MANSNLKGSTFLYTIWICIEYVANVTKGLAECTMEQLANAFHYYKLEKQAVMDRCMPNAQKENY